MSGSKVWRLARLPIVLSLMWCAFMVFMYQRGSATNERNSNEQALIQARTLYTHILDTRAWNSEHGGVYVHESEYGQPNIWIPEAQRTMPLSDGKRLVLINPAYMSRQISERTVMRGTSFRITSHAPLRPENASDSWETKALAACISGVPEVFTKVSEADGTRFRYLGALRTQASCLGCHPENRVGDVRGGISVSQDATSFVRTVAEQNKSLMLAFGLMGVAGTLCIGGVTSFLHRKRAIKEERERMKTTFMANMSHDMRTPLAGILGMTELLSHSAEKPEQREALQYLHLAGAALLEIVTDITDYAALDVGKLELSERVFDLHVAMKRCMDLFRPQCMAKGIYLQLDLEPDVPHFVYGDEFRLRQALGNLLSNSAKFTNHGGIAVRVSKLRSLGEGSVPADAGRASSTLTLRFEIRDTGAGIAIEEQARIFERFERGSTAVQSGFSGTGLGLSIAKDIAHRMNGSVMLSSEPGKGACFTLTLQFKNIDPNWQENKGEIQNHGKADCFHASGRLRSASILLAEDNAVTAHFVTQVLEHDGHKVRLALNGQEALDMLVESPADLVLLDMRMPGLDGMGTVKAIREREKLNGDHTPIVVMSASVLEGEEECLVKMNVEDTLLKPVMGEDLLRIVERYALVSGEGADRGQTRDKKNEATVFVKDVSLSDVPEARQMTFNHVATLDALDGNHALLHSLCSIWLEESTQQEEDLVQAVNCAQETEVRRLAHALKNSAATLHLSALRHEADLLEKAGMEEAQQRLPLIQNCVQEAREAIKSILEHEDRA